MKRSLITMKLLSMLGAPTGAPPLIERYSETKTEISEASGSLQLPEYLFETFLCNADNGYQFSSLMVPHQAYDAMYSTEVAA